MKINIMAAGGLLGRKVIQALLNCGVDPGDLIASVRTPAKVFDIARTGVDVRRTDYDDLQSLKYSYRNSDVVVVITTLGHIEERKQQFDNVLEAICQCRVKRVLLASFAAAGPKSLFTLAPFYQYAEKKLQESDLAWTILRNGMYFDPVAEWIPDLIKMGRLPYPVKEGRVAYITHDDVARALAYACISSQHAGQVYELTGPEALRMEQVANVISQVSGEEVVFDSISEEAYAEICRADQIPEEMIETLTSMYRAVDNGEFETVTDHVEKITGKTPESIAAYLQRRYSK